MEVFNNNGRRIRIQTMITDHIDSVTEGLVRDETISVGSRIEVTELKETQAYTMKEGGRYVAPADDDV